MTIILILIVTFASCTDKKTLKTDSTIMKSDSSEIKQSDKSIEFLNIFKNIEPQGLHIYPPILDENGEIIKTPHEGVIIDVHKFQYTDNNDIFVNIDACKKGDCNIYAIGKFDINDNYIGLLFRQWSQYSESLIQLMLWDKKGKKIISGLDLADSFGDEGWYFVLESWIKNYQSNGQLEIISRKKDFIPKEEFTSIEDSDSIITDTLRISYLSNSKFITKLYNQPDKTKYKLKNWK